MHSNKIKIFCIYYQNWKTSFYSDYKRSSFPNLFKILTITMHNFIEKYLKFKHIWTTWVHSRKNRKTFFHKFLFFLACDRHDTIQAIFQFSKKKNWFYMIFEGGSVYNISTLPKWSISTLYLDCKKDPHLKPWWINVFFKSDKLPE